MAVQAQFYSENLGLLPMCLQDWEANPVYGIEDDPCFLSLPYHQQTQYQQQQSTQNLGFDCNQGASSSSTCNSFPPMSLSQSLDGQLQNQRHEIDCIIQLQKEKLIHALQEQRKQQLAVLLSNLESKSKDFD
ncbi:E3 ubiquitin-protein ligase BOI [Quillaja saponaria]|uniref:E3 ubiquitin-protein ligase BOI n=1 Tax=Quillaja saponaria TaxID=32244 RepID=A0AAD7LH59_QUISA|nr:E3 ubiquitin-protein ligase BOI [Quillaja saponaria]